MQHKDSIKLTIDSNFDLLKLKKIYKQFWKIRKNLFNSFLCGVYNKKMFQVTEKKKRTVKKNKNNYTAARHMPCFF